MALVLGFLSDTGLIGGDERAWVTHTVHPESAAAWERTESVTGQAPSTRGKVLDGKGQSQ